MGNYLLFKEVIKIKMQRRTQKKGFHEENRAEITKE